MRIKLRPLNFFLGCLWVVCFIFMSQELSAIRYLDQVKTFEDRGVATFKPTKIFTHYYEDSKIRSHHVVRTKETRYIVHYTGPSGYSYDVQKVTRSSAEALQQEGPVQRRILANTADKTYMTIDGHLTVDQYIAQERVEGLKMVAYWILLEAILLGILFVMLRNNNKA